MGRGIMKRKYEEFVGRCETPMTPGVSDASSSVGTGTWGPQFGEIAAPLPVGLESKMHQIASTHRLPRV
jgi:hypothetical protein